MKIEFDTAQKPSRNKNDDIAGYSGHTFWLMDGATQLVAPDHGLDASWHVGQLDRAFRQALAHDKNISLDNLARQAISQTGDLFYAGSGLTADAPQGLRPFCTMILCRVDPAATAMDYLVISDSTLAVIGEDRQEIFTDQRIDSDQPLAGFYDLLTQGYGFDSAVAKTEMMAVYHHVFGRLNRPGGWFTVGQDSTVIDQAVTGSVALKPTDHILLMSDGFTRAVDTLQMYADFHALNGAIGAMGIKTVLTDIRQCEAGDSQGRRYSRSSIHDDATALRISLT